MWGEGSRTTSTGPVPAPLTQKDIEDGLRQLGLGRGDAVEVHSSLSSFGWVESGAPPVVEALMNVVGEQGALVMSAYPVTPAIPLSEEEKARGIAWKVRILREDTTEKTGMGAIVEEFVRRPGVICGRRLPRVCAWGRNAQMLSEGYQRLLEMDGWALLLGVDITRCSSMHQAEVRVGIPEEIGERFRIPEEISRDYPANTWSIGYGSAPGDPWRKVWEEAQRRGLIRERRIGRAECKLFRAEALVSIYEHLLRTDPYGLFGVEKRAPPEKASNND